jgi:hypothetical protein
MPTSTITLTPTVTPWVPVGEVWHFYYYAGAVRIAVWVKDPTHEQVYYLLADHLPPTGVLR